VLWLWLPLADGEAVAAAFAEVEFPDDEEPPPC